MNAWNHLKLPIYFSLFKQEASPANSVGFLLSLLLYLLSLQERSKAEALNKHLRRQMTDYRAPDVTQYMDVKDRHTKLRRSIHMLERRSGITEVNAV